MAKKVMVGMSGGGDNSLTAPVFKQQGYDVVGGTPNVWPGLEGCNQFIKFDALLEKAQLFGAEYVATGHYVRVGYDAASGRYLLRKAADPAKDQSYVLYVMT